ncbi:MAG: isochorismatase family protein [Planctomycetota bacterium]|nr:MAG: isochorismatase family protein [Planctomycetota bacterium]
MSNRASDVFVDLCVQREYVGRNGGHPCANAATVARNLKHLMAFARWTKTPVLSCIDRCDYGQLAEPPDAAPEPHRHPDLRKPTFTVLPRHIVIESDNFLCVPLNLFHTYQQAIFTKIHRDPFTNPKLDRLLTELPARRFVVFGLPLESSLRILALGLLRRGRDVVVIEDACGYWREQEARMVLRQLAVKGCRIASTCEFLTSELAQRGKRKRVNGRPGRFVA